MWRLVKLITTLKVTIKLPQYHKYSLLVRVDAAKLILNVQLDMTVEAAASAAAKQLGYRALNLQLEIIKGIATARDVFAVLPTGYGKSLCYGCLPLV